MCIRDSVSSMERLICVVIGYLFGLFQTGYFYGKLKHIDIRQHGSLSLIHIYKLEEYGARATFFMVGTNAAKYPDTIKRMEEIGCEIGNHTTNHKNLVKLDDASIKEEIQSTDAAIAAAVGHGASLLLSLIHI